MDNLPVLGGQKGPWDVPAAKTPQSTPNSRKLDTYAITHTKRTGQSKRPNNQQKQKKSEAN